MYNCIFSNHCCETVCDKSCPILTQTTYLLERNNIDMQSNVFNTDPKRLHRFENIVDKSEGTFRCYMSNDTVNDAELLTYCSICKHWKASRLHCTVYNLKYSQYLDMIKQSWGSYSESSELEYMKIWASTAKVLIVSNIDYVNFKDFECQTLLNLLQSRASKEFTTIIVSPETKYLVGNSRFFPALTNKLDEAVIR